MRKVIVTEYVSLDGVMQDPGGAEREHFKPGGWSMSYWNDDIAKFKYDELFASDALLLGRVTYEGFAAAWPKATDTGDFGERMNGLPKYVVSTTLQELSWNNSHLLTGNLSDEIARLKQQPGQNILVGGSSELVRSLREQNLVDEYSLLVYPVILGSGKRLFQDANEVQALKLIEARSFSSGVVLLSYQPA